MPRDAVIGFLDKAADTPRVQQKVRVAVTERRVLIPGSRRLE
jgi:hypothetical protein